MSSRTNTWYYEMINPASPNAFDYKLDQNTQNHFYLPLVCAKLIQTLLPLGSL